MPSLRSRRLDGSSGRKKERARERETRVSTSRAPVLFCAHYFQARATQAKICPNKSSSDCYSCWMLKGQMNQKIDIFSFVALPSPNTKNNHPK